MQLLPHLLNAVLLLSILFLPGAALWIWLRREQSGLLEALAESAALSISLYALLGLLGYLAGLRFSPLAVILFLFLSFISLVAGLVRQRNLLKFTRADALGLLLLALLAAWRYFQARNLALPAWVDSVHHTLIVQKFLEAGSVPASLAPEVQAPFFYHYGFHAVTALFAGLSELPAERAVLALGQTLNTLAALAIYRLGRAFWPQGGKAALAALLAGFALQMPAYYLAWGRYTLLTGMVLLPVGIALAHELAAARTGEESWQRPLKLQILTAGLALSHLLALALLGVYLLIHSTAEGLRWRSLRPALSVLWPAGLGVALALPWLVRILRFTGRYAGFEVVAPGAQSSAVYGAYLWELAGPLRNQVLLGLALLGLVWLLLRGALRRLAVFAAVLAFLAMPWGLRFEPFRPDHLVIVLYLPAALLLAELAGRLFQWSGRLPWRVRLAGFALLGAALLTWSLVDTANLVRADTILADQADVQALDWVRENTPADARFLINTRLWQAASYRGVDGGYWISTYTGRKQLLPPAVYGYGTPEEIRRVNDLAARASTLTGCDDAFWQLVRENQIGYVYLKESVGSLQPQALTACPGLLVVYQRQGVYLFAVVE